MVLTPQIWWFPVNVHPILELRWWISMKVSKMELHWFCTGREGAPGGVWLVYPEMPLSLCRILFHPITRWLPCFTDFQHDAKAAADFLKSRRHPMANVLVTILIFNAYPGFSLHGLTGSCNRGFCSTILIHVCFACIKFVSVIVCWLSFHFRYSQISSLQPLQGGAPKIAKMVNITPISQWFLLVIHRTSFHWVNLNR